MILRSEPSIEIVQSPPFPRIWFLNEQKTELIQVQQDRFARNWRKAKDTDIYPRYDHVRGNFTQELGDFRDFLVKEKIGQFAPNQCEVTYVNHISSGEGWEKHGQLHEVLSTSALRYTDAFLGEPEDIRSATRYIIRDEGGQPMGRLHITVEPAWMADGKAIFILVLTARGRPLQENVEGVMQFLDIGHEWIVRGFASITTESMQKVWRRKP